MLKRIERDNKREGYGELLEFLSGLSADEIKKIDFSEFHEMLFYDIEGFDGDLEVIYAFGNYDAEFKKAEERIRECDQTNLICQYIDYHDVDGEDFVQLGVRAIGSVMTDKEDELESLRVLKAKAVEKRFI